MTTNRISRQNSLDRYRSGFTLVELVVSFAIIGILSTVIIINQRDFDKSVNLKNIAHEVSILLREQQSYATNVLAKESIGFDESTDGFADTDRGVIINTTDPNNVSFELFYDENENGRYDSGETISASNIVLPSKYTIRQVCSFNNATSPQRRLYCLRKGGGFDYPEPGQIGLKICQGVDSGFGASGTPRENSPIIVFARPLLQPKMFVKNENNSRGICEQLAGSTMENDRVSFNEIDRIEIVIGLTENASPIARLFNNTSRLARSMINNHAFIAMAASGSTEDLPVDEKNDKVEIVVIEANGAIYVK